MQSKHATYSGRARLGNEGIGRRKHLVEGRVIGEVRHVAQGIGDGGHVPVGVVGVVGRIAQPVAWGDSFWT